MIPCFALAAVAHELHKLDVERLKSMTPEQRAEEFRGREVRALERIAAAVETHLGTPHFGVPATHFTFFP